MRSYKFHFGERFELVMHIAFYLTLLCQNVAALWGRDMYMTLFKIRRLQAEAVVEHCGSAIE